MKTLYIEGTSETDNGNLRKPFHFFWKELSGNMPRIMMGDGLKQKTAKKLFPTEKKSYLCSCEMVISEITISEMIHYCGKRLNQKSYEIF